MVKPQSVLYAFRRLLYVCISLCLACAALYAEAPLTLDGKASYALGVLIGLQVDEADITALDSARFADGFCDFLLGESTMDYENALSLMMTLVMSNEQSALDAEMSYACGIVIGGQIKESDAVLASMVLERKSFKEGFMATLSGSATMDGPAAIALLEPLLREAGERQLRQNKEAGERFLAENAKKSGIRTTKSGLQYRVEKAGSGKKPGTESRVTVNYEGRLINGEVFDSSYKRGEPAQFLLGEVIPGWTEGIQLIGAGGKITLYIPSGLGYGDTGAGPIPPSSVLIFDVELLSIE